MRAAHTKTIGAYTFEVRELIVAEIRIWLADLLNQHEPDLVAEALFEELSLGDIPRLTSLTAEQLESMAPSEIKQVIALAKEVNGDFFGLRAKLRAATLTAPTAVSSG